MELSYDILQDVRDAIAIKQNESTTLISNFSEEIHGSYRSIKNILAQELILMEKNDNITGNCHTYILGNVCDLIWKEAIDGSERINRIWRVCEYTYIDNLEVAVEEVAIQIRNTSRTLPSFKERIDNCLSDDCLLETIFDIVKERRVVMNQIIHLTEDFISKQKNTLNNVETCVLDSTTSFIKEYTGVSKIYCDCIAVYIQYHNGF